MYAIMNRSNNEFQSKSGKVVICDLFIVNNKYHSNTYLGGHEIVTHDGFMYVFDAFNYNRT